MCKFLDYFKFIWRVIISENFDYCLYSNYLVWVVMQKTKPYVDFQLVHTYSIYGKIWIASAVIAFQLSIPDSRVDHGWSIWISGIIIMLPCRFLNWNSHQVELLKCSLAYHLKCDIHLSIFTFRCSRIKIQPNQGRTSVPINNLCRSFLLYLNWSFDKPKQAKCSYSYLPHNFLSLSPL